ncbi:SRPBCC domain-containing protein [Mucilaginibacter roseus]|uniref:SRPBCC domain-containing protein n=1 Tax=Mucilaginibacter roseus TaxID=1528868 RepID=A0ABS8U2Y0_9SPHI|nr:SRPBCC domain-containing protein [Mucilaginibacter roseus]MCD8741478.1 SRPBCC domain-containing protein [Mucilaginibacter roseus]
MKNVPIVKQVEIAASPEKVWRVLFNNELNRQWLSYFSAGTFAETDWREGSRVTFADGSNNGITGFILVGKPHTEVVIEYDGFILNGVTDTTSEDAQNYKGAKESYLLTENNGHTVLAISSDMGEEHFDQMSAAWDEALLKIKSMAESL